jgi:hypothetical protein
LNIIFDGILWKTMLTFVDDIVTWADDFEQAVERVTDIFDRIARSGIKLRPDKCKLLAREIKFLSYTVSEQGIVPCCSKISAITEWPRPKCVRDVRAFTSTCSYYRSHIKDFAKICQPLYLLTKRGQPFEWTDSQETAMRTLKELLTNAPLLVSPRDGDEFELHCDAPYGAAGWTLNVWRDGKLHPVLYGSKVFSGPQLNYCATMKELLACILALKSTRHIILGQKQVKLVTDNTGLSHLMTSKKMLTGQESRYLEFVSDFDLVFVYTSGASHLDADGLSRRGPCEPEPGRPGCKQCRHIWSADHRSTGCRPTINKSVDTAVKELSDIRDKGSHSEAFDRRNGCGKSTSHIDSIDGMTPFIDETLAVHRKTETDGQAINRPVLFAETDDAQHTDRGGNCSMEVIDQHGRSSESPGGDGNNTKCTAEMNLPDFITDDALQGGRIAPHGNSVALIDVNDTPRHGCVVKGRRIGPIYSTAATNRRGNGGDETDDDVNDSDRDDSEVASSMTETDGEEARGRAAPQRNDTILSLDIIRRNQQQDTEINTIMTWLIGEQTEPTRDELLACSPDVQYMWAQKMSLQVIDGILYRNYERVDGLILYRQVVVPYSLRGRYLQLVHDDLFSCHPGIGKTFLKLQKYAYWPGYRRQAELHVRRCHICNQARRGPASRQGPLLPNPVSAPWQRLFLDLTGPHPISTSGFKYLATLMDGFSKFLIVVPLKNKSALTVARAIVDRVYTVFGVGDILTTDGGREFNNLIQDNLNRILGIQACRVLPYKPQANAVKRVHRSINGLLSRVIQEDLKTWDETVKFSVASYNAAEHSATGFSPYYLLFGRERSIPLDLLTETSRLEPPVTTDDYTQLVQERFRKAYALTREHLKASFMRAKQRYDQRVKHVQFVPNDYVYLFSPRRKLVGLGHKFAFSSTGVYKVIRAVNKVNYVLQRTPKSKPFISHIDRMFRHYGDVPAAWATNERQRVSSEQSVVPASDRSTDDLSVNRPENGDIDPAHSDSMRDRQATVDETPACLTDRGNDASKGEESQSADPWRAPPRDENSHQDFSRAPTDDSRQTTDETSRQANTGHVTTTRNHRPRRRRRRPARLDD